MKKQKTTKKNIILVLIILILGVSIFAYAGSNNTKQELIDSFLQVSAKEVVKNEEIVLTFDIDKIPYESFEFVLSSSIELGNLLTEDTKSTKVTFDEETGDLTISANKSDIDMNQIKIYYTIPDSLAIGSRIKLKATVSNLEENKEEIKDNQIIENNVQNEVTNQVVIQKQTVEITLTVVEKKATMGNAGSENGINNENANILENSKNPTSQGNDQTKTTVSNIKTMTSVQGSLNAYATETVTYKGSYDNYLSDIVVNGYTLIPEFAKTNQTYFLTVANDITSLEVEAVKSDSSVTVKIYGNTDLEVGYNKILISVTAENGNVRTYRIYVMREA